MNSIAVALDAAHGGAAYKDAVVAADAALRDSTLVPSARVLATMASEYGQSYLRFTRTHSLLTKEATLRLPYSDESQARFVNLARQSIEKQQAIEAADDVPFEIYRQRYLSAERLGLPAGRTGAPGAAPAHSPAITPTTGD